GKKSIAEPIGSEEDTIPLAIAPAALHRGHQHPLHSGQLQAFQHCHHADLLQEHKKFVQQPGFAQLVHLLDLFSRVEPLAPRVHHLAAPVASSAVPSRYLARWALHFSLALLPCSSRSPFFPTIFSFFWQPILDELLLIPEHQDNGWNGNEKPGSQARGKIVHFR